MELLAGVAAELQLPGPSEDPVALKAPVDVTVTKASDGSEIVGVAEQSKEGEPWTLALSGSEIATPDRLSVLWGDADSVYSQAVEVVGGFACSLAAIEEKVDEEIDDVKVEVAREVATREIESACGLAFRPRFYSETGVASSGERMILPLRQVTAVLGVVQDGSAWSAGQVAALRIDPLGVIVNPSGWTAGSEVTVTYVAGYQSFAAAIIPVRDYAAYLLTNRPTDWMERATGITTDMGSYSLVTAGVGPARFPLPSVNAFVNQYSTPLVG